MFRLPLPRSLAVILFGLGLTACDLAMQPSQLLSNAPVDLPNRTLQTTVEGKPPLGWTRKLAAGSHWVEIGRIAEGTVYKPRDIVLTAEARNVSEAYLVVRDRRWVGFWLPVEKAFVPTENAVPIELQ
jgi:hypothetical protein